MMKYKKILVVYKKPLLKIYREKSKRLEMLIEEGLNTKDLELELKENRKARKVVRKVLEEDKKVKVDWKYRAYLSKDLITNYDLIMTFGGDGTLIEASHYIDNKPVFGINSDYRPEYPESSEGFLTSSNRYNFSEKYKQLQKGKLKEYKFNRLQAELNGKKLEELILNEIFISHKDPAATSRMVLKDKSIVEFQKNDGLIIATPTSNWAKVYGGAILPLTRNMISYVARGLFIGKLNQHPKLKKGVTDYLEVHSKMRNGEISIDGKHIKYPFGLGAKLKVYPSKTRFTILGFDEEKIKFYSRKK